MSNATPVEYVREHREELVALALDLIAVDTSNPPGDTREVVAAIERFLDLALSLSAFFVGGLVLPTVFVVWHAVV